MSLLLSEYVCIPIFIPDDLLRKDKKSPIEVLSPVLFSCYFSLLGNKVSDTMFICYARHDSLEIRLNMSHKGPKIGGLWE